MAEGKDDLDHLTCSICVDMYREPVSLPCNHSYCRQCLHMFAERAKDRKQDHNPSDTAGDATGHVTISCPVCRTSTNLGTKGVGGLAVNQTLLKATNKLQREDSGPCCSMCEDKKSPAITICTTCSILYCEDCLVLHPMRGPLKRHSLISIEQYISQPANQDHGKIDEKPLKVTRPAACEKHKEPVSMYCFKCEQLICDSCLGDHHGHGLDELTAAYEKQKVMIDEKEKACKKLRKKLKELGVEMQVVDAKVKNKVDLKTAEVEKAYRAALATLEAWRSRSLDAVRARYCTKGETCGSAMQNIHLQVEQSGEVLQSTDRLRLTSLEDFLQGSRELTGQYNIQLESLSRTLKEGDKMVECFLNALKYDTVKPRQLVVAESPDYEDVLRPFLKFKGTNNRQMLIKDKGSVMEVGNIQTRTMYDVWTDGMLESGHYYWELHICQVLGVGVDISTGVGHSVPGAGDETIKAFWGITLTYVYFAWSKQASFRCTTDHTHCWIRPPYNELQHTSFPQSVSFRLDTDARTLTISDCTNRKEMCTITEVEVSEPLTPCVRVLANFNDTSSFVSIRLANAIIMQR